MRYALLICVALMCVSCAQGEGYTRLKVYDKVYEAALIKQLKSEGIPFTIQGNVLRYKTKYSDEVLKAMGKANMAYPALFTVKDKSLAARFRKKLAESKIPYRLSSDSEGDAVFIVDSAYRMKVSKLLEAAAAGK